MKKLKMLFLELIIFWLLGVSCISKKEKPCNFSLTSDIEKDSLMKLWKNDKRGCLGKRKQILKKFHTFEKLFKKGHNFQELKQLIGEPDQKVYKNNGKTTINNYFIECGIDGYILHIVEEEQKPVVWQLVVI